MVVKVLPPTRTCKCEYRGCEEQSTSRIPLAGDAHFCSGHAKYIKRCIERNCKKSYSPKAKGL